MAIKIEPFQLLSNKGEIVRSFPETILHPAEAIHVFGSNWSIAQAIVYSAFGFDESLIRDLGYKVQRKDGNTARKPLKLNYASPSPRGEISLFWDTVEEEITLGDIKLSEGQLFKRVIDTLGLETLLKRQPEQLSGGETAKVVLAGHLLNQPNILVIDRGLGEIDVQTRSAVINFVKEGSDKTLLVALDNAPLEGINVYIDTDQNPICVTNIVPTSVKSSHSLFSYNQFEIAFNTTPQDSSSSYLLIDDLVVERNNRVLFEGLSIKAPYGSLLWVLGPNGSGKTSFFEALLNLIQPKMGNASWVEDNAPCDLVRHIAYSPQDPEADVTELTIVEEVELAFEKRGKPDAMKWLADIGVPTSLFDVPLSDDISLKKMASVLSAIGRSKKVCLLDEPTLFLSDVQKLWVINAMRMFLTSGGVILCSTHDNRLFDAFHNIQME